MHARVLLQRAIGFSITFGVGILLAFLVSRMASCRNGLHPQAAAAAVACQHAAQSQTACSRWQPTALQEQQQPSLLQSWEVPQHPPCNHAWLVPASVPL